MSENETQESTAEAVDATTGETADQVKAETTGAEATQAETADQAKAETTGADAAEKETSPEPAAEAASEAVPESNTEPAAKTEPTSDELSAEAAPDAEAKAEDAPAEPTEATEPEEPEEISYHAVEKEGEITAIWEMQGRKHLRTISARSSEGQKILSLFTSEIHETDSPAMGNAPKAETPAESAETSTEEATA